MSTTTDELKELMFAVQSDVKQAVAKMDNITEEVKQLKNLMLKYLKI